MTVARRLREATTVPDSQRPARVRELLKRDLSIASNKSSAIFSTAAELMVLGHRDWKTYVYTAGRKYGVSRYEGNNTIAKLPEYVRQALNNER